MEAFQINSCKSVVLLTFQVLFTSSSSSDPILLYIKAIKIASKSITNLPFRYSALIVCYLPYASVAAVMGRTLGDLSPSNAVTWNATLMLVFFNSSLNPFLYYWKIREVRQAVKATLRQINVFSLNKYNRRRNLIIFPLNNVSIIYRVSCQISRVLLTTTVLKLVSNHLPPYKHTLPKLQGQTFPHAI